MTVPIDASSGVTNQPTANRRATTCQMFDTPATKPMNTATPGEADDDQRRGP